MNTDEYDNFEIKSRVVKYKLEITEHQSIEIGGNMPKFLAVRELGVELVIWVEQEIDYPGTFKIDIDIAETDKEFYSKGSYVGTVIMSTGKELHVYAKSHYTRAG